MNPGHEDCAHEIVDEKTLCPDGGVVRIICLHDHKEPVTASDGILEHAVGWHCHCCGNVWNSHDYIEKGSACLTTSTALSTQGHRGPQ